MDDASTPAEAVEIVDRWYDGDPETPFELDEWHRAAGAGEHAAREIVRMRRFLVVRGAPGGPASLPLLWDAMKAHVGWRSWFGITVHPNHRGEIDA